MLSFACHDHHDAQHLEKIFKTHMGNSQKPSIITSQFLVSGNICVEEQSIYCMV